MCPNSTAGQMTSSSLSQGCSGASPCPSSTLKPITTTAAPHLQASSQPCTGAASPARKDQGDPHLLHRAPSGVRTTALAPLSSPSHLTLTMAPYYLVVKGRSTAPRCSPSMPNPTLKNPDATASRSSSMRSYTLTQTVRLLSHPCGLALEPQCLFLGAFPSNEV